LEPGNYSALAAIFGSLTGALASSLSTWITQKHVDGIFWLSESFAASSYILALSAKERMPWLMPSNITFKGRTTSLRPMRFEPHPSELLNRCARER